jgi:site-specific DNA recombinase
VRVIPVASGEHSAVRFGPFSEMPSGPLTLHIMSTTDIAAYSMTSEVGSSTPSAFAVLRLTANHRMTPSHARKRGIKCRYYISSALLQARAKEAGTVSRVPADEIEVLIAESVRGPLNASTEIEAAVLIQTHVARVEIQLDQLVIELVAKGAGRKRKQGRNVIQVPWRKTPPTRRREILIPDTPQPENARPIRSENRALLVASIARGRRWLDELIADPAATTESIAKRESCSTRRINMTISFAFLAPDLVKAAIDGRLPHGMGVARLADLSAEWSRQRQMLGLPVLQSC